MIKLFIKNTIDSQDSLKNDKLRSKYGLFCSYLGITLNLLLFFIKIFLGVISNSISIITDSFNNFSDFSSSIVSLIGFKLSNKLPDKEHPFGHGRIEYISAFIISFIIILLGIEFLKTSVTKVFNPSPITFNLLIIAILFITLFVKIWIMIYFKKIAKLIDSKSLYATAVDSRNDIFITSITILSSILYFYFNINLDGYFGIIVSLFLIYSGFSISKETLSPLIGEKIDKTLEFKIKDIIFEFDNIIGIHELLVHNYGPNKNIATIHVEVPSNIGIKLAHDIVDRIEKRVFNELGVFLTIHIDPVDLEDKRVNLIREKVSKVIKDKPNVLAYDYRIISNEFFDEIVFDLSLPYNMLDSDRNEIILKIKEEIHLLDKKYQVTINIVDNFS